MKSRVKGIHVLQGGTKSWRSLKTCRGKVIEKLIQGRLTEPNGLTTSGRVNQRLLSVDEAGQLALYDDIKRKEGMKKKSTQSRQSTLYKVLDMQKL